MGKTILITGASSGIGKATARLFHNRGWNVIATMRSPEQEQELIKLDRVLVTRLDVQDAESIASAIQIGLSRFGRIEVLLNNAGYGAYGPLEATSLDKIRRQFDVNVIGLLATTRSILPHFRSNQSGLVINISSIGGKMTFPLGTLYHGSKFAVEGLSEALHYELAAIGARVKIIEPGMVKTDFAGRSFDFNNDPTLVEYQPLVHSFVSALGPMNETASPPETVAQAIYRAAEDESDQLRYEIGADAEQILASRKTSDDAAFLAGIRAQFGIV